MPPPMLTRRMLGPPAVGARASFTRTITEADCALFIGVTWDLNPYHTDETFASSSRFGKRIAPGLLTASLFTHIGGLWGFLASEMRFEFLAPVCAGDTVTAEAEITELDEARRFVRLRCRAVLADGREVIRGTIAGYPALQPGEGG